MNKLTNQKEMKKKKTEMLLISSAHLLSAKDSHYPLGCRGIVIFFYHSDMFLYHNLKHTFYEDSRRLDERSLNIHMPRVNVDK